MQIRTPGRSLQVSAVGLGCMGFSHAYGAPTDAQDAVTLLRQAYAYGFSYTFLTRLRCTVPRRTRIARAAGRGNPGS